MATSNKLFIGSMVIVVAAILGSVWLGSQLTTTHSISPVNPVNSTGGSGAPSGWFVGTSSSPIPSWPSIGQSQQAQNYQVLVETPDPTKAISGGKYQYTLVGSQTIYKCSQYPTIQTVGCGTATSSSTTYTDVGGISPGVTDLLYSGDNSGHFLNSTYANAGTQANLAVPIDSQAYSAPTLYFANTSNPASNKGTIADVHSVVPGQTAPVDFYVAIKAGTYLTSQQDLLAVVTFNGVAWQGFTLDGVQPIASVNSGYPEASFSYLTSNTDNPSFAELGTQQSTDLFLLPSAGLINGAYEHTNGASQGQYYMNLQGTPTTAFAVNEIVGFGIVAGTQYFNATSGKVNNCGGQGCFWNPQTKSNFFKPVYTQNAFVASTN